MFVAVERALRYLRANGVWRRARLCAALCTLAPAAHAPLPPVVNIQIESVIRRRSFDPFFGFPGRDRLYRAQSVGSRPTLADCSRSRWFG